MRHLLLTMLMTIATSSAIAQTFKPCNEKIYRVTDVLPTPTSPIETVLAALDNEVAIPDSLRNRKGHLFISYVITCNGDVTKLRLIKKGDWDGTVFYEPFEILVPKIKKTIARVLKYNPALQGGKPVDFYQILSVSFDNGRTSLSTTNDFSR